VTSRRSPSRPDGYDPQDYPPFAVTVDVVILTLADGLLQVLLVRRGAEPFAGMWAIPGGFKTPGETLDDAAHRELIEETGVDAAAVMSQFGAYGDPGRDPRMNVVTIAYLAVLRDLGGVVAGTDAIEAKLVPVRDIVRNKVELAFDHHRILRDAIERVRHDLETTGLATAFVGPTFTLSELRSVYEAIWETELDGANFRRTLRGDDWVVATGRRSAPGPEGGKPPELFRAGRAWRRGGPIRRPRPSR
jgi:8-oxo-dGTP diphosphatase